MAQLEQARIFEGFGAPEFREPESFLQLMEFTKYRELELSGSTSATRCDTIEIADHPLCSRFALTGNNAHILSWVRKQEKMRR